MFIFVCSFQGDAVAFQAVYGRVFSEYRCVEPDQFQHPFRPQDPHDHLSGNSPPGIHGLPMDHRQLDAETVREVSHRQNLLSNKFSHISLLFSPPHLLCRKSKDTSNIQCWRYIALPTLIELFLSYCYEKWSPDLRSPVHI